MSVTWLRRVDGPAVVVLLGAFDPPTNAHVALLRSASLRLHRPGAFCLTSVLLDRTGDRLLDEKTRLSVLGAIAADEGFGLATAPGGTYLEVARAIGLDATFVIGSDKLPQLRDSRFYPDGEEGVNATFDEVRFLVVERDGGEGVDASEVFSDAGVAAISATEVRRRVRCGEEIGALVPAVVAEALAGYTAAG
jgi:nicotinic acid mononucleotide adenylyltransferase